ncbi:MAG: hypothetical protein JWO30_918 [Fibrobacteres bacterium]|nr:hypothetical protein [Fibrobacterota bacterium]
MKPWLVPLLFVSTVFSAGPSCLEPANRFRLQVFPNVAETDNVQFGQNKNPLFANRVENLLMNIFQPSGDACTKRPLVLFMHGGWMQGGGRGDETGTAQQFAKRGFVAASIEYRLGVGGTFSPKNFATPGFMATQDARAAIRFFRKNAAQYGVDTNFIYVGGCSAGAYAALFTAYLDKTGEIPPYVDAGALDGGIEGNSGNPGYSSKFNGVLSLSGGVLDTTWINPGDVPVVAVQCSADPLVPDGGDSLRNPNTQVPFLPSFGASAVKARAIHMGISAAVLTFQASCHCPHPGGPGGIDSTLDFFGKSVYNLMTAPATSLQRLAAVLSVTDLPQLSQADGIYDMSGKSLDPAGLKDTPSSRTRFRPGLFLLRYRP